MALSSPKARELEQETEIIPAIRHEDAEWKVIQQNTFTRWVNNHLKKANSSIQSLETDFSDGLKLIDLAMVLSQKNLGKFNKKVNFRSQKMENVTLALNFFQEVEKIKIINIDSSHIVDKNKKLILGLIWTLILHYSISMGWIVEKREGQPDETPKQKLLNWVRGHLPGGMPVTNFTSDWNDGIALGALVNSMAPGSCPSWSEWTPDNALANTEKAIEEAKERLGIEPLIAPAELIHPEIDEMSVMTYLSQFPAAKPIQAPPKPLPSPAPVPIVSGEFRGIDRDPIVHQPFEFDVTIVGDGYKPKVSVVDREGKPIHHTVSKKDAHNFSVKCTPVTLGDHSLGLQLIDVISGETTPVPSADASFHVLPAPRLREYPERVKIGEEVKLTVENAFKGPVDVFVVDGDGGEEKLVVTESAEPGVHCTEYTPKVKGLHSINVFHRKNQIENSPFALRVSDNTPESLLVWGRGICEDGIRSGDPVPIHVRSLNDDDVLHQDDVKLNIKHKDSGNVLPVFPLTHHNKDVSFHYTPISEGDYEIDVQYKDKPIGKSPYKVTVSPSTSSEVRAFGPGLEGGVADETSVFEVLTNGKADRLAFSIEGPSETEITCQSKDHGTALVAYKPSVPGVYKVNVLAAGDHIQDSPFVFMVDPKEENFHPAAARVHDLNGNDIHLAREPVVFNIDTKLAESHDVPKVVVLDSKMDKLPVNVSEKTPGFYEAKFIPEKAGIYHVDASLKNVALPGAPFSIAVKEPVDVSKLYMYGPGIDGPVTSQEPTHFTIDAKQAGPGTVEVSLEDRAGKSVDIDVLDNQDGSFTVKYIAPRPGAYELNVIFAGEKIPPIEINVRPHVDISGVRVEGLENGDVYLGHKMPVKIFVGDLKRTKQGLEFLVNIKGKDYIVPLSDHGDHFQAVYRTSEVGPAEFKVLFDDLLVANSRLNVLPGYDAKKCKASGPGLKEGVVNVPSEFTIDTEGAGEGAVSVDISGPAECLSNIVDLQDGTCNVEFSAPVPGEYVVGVRYGAEKDHIPGSPFAVTFDYPKDPSAITIKGLDKPLRNCQPFDFVVDASATKAGPVVFRLPPVYQQPLVESDPANRIHSVRFTPVGEPGDIIPLEVCYSGSPVPGSPFMLTLLPDVDVNQIQLKDRDGESLESIPSSKEASFVIDAQKCGVVKTVKADVYGPDGRLRECNLSPHEKDGWFILRFPTDVAGDYAVNVSVNSLPVPTKTVRAVPHGKVENVVIDDGAKRKHRPTTGESNLPVLVTSQPSELVFSADDPNVGFAAVSADPDAVKLSIEAIPDGSRLRHVVSLKPLKTGVNTVSFYYGGQKIDEIKYNALPQSSVVKVQEDAEKFELPYNQSSAPRSPESFYPREFKFEVGSSPANLSNLEAVVTMPTNQKDHAQIVDNHDGSVLVKYHPTTAGQHELIIFQNGAQVQGTPVKFFVDSHSDGYATCYGPGLQNAVVGEPAAFTVCAKGTNAKDLQVSVEGPAQSSIQIHDNKDGTCSVTWMPPVPGEYKVHVKLGNKAVKNSPFTVLAAGEGQKRAHLSVGSTSEVALNITESELKGISASIKSPSGIEEPCFVRLIDGGRLGVSFTPRESGEHLITVKRNGKLVPKAPFKIKVDKSQVGDASKVEVSGTGKSRAVCLQDNEILVDTTKAGYGGLSVSVQGPSKAELSCKEVKAGLIKVIYKPSEPGVYAIAIKFADHHVKDSPITVNCTGKGAGTIVQKITRHAEQGQMCLPNQDAYLFLKLPNCSPMDVVARVMDPKGKTEDVEMRDTGENYYQIRFRPESEGVYNLSVFHKDAHINGSPFQFTVGTFGEAGAHKVRASGMGVVRGETNTKMCFNLYTREAGPGELAVSVEGPSKATVEFKDHKDGNCHVEYKVATPGEYIVSAKFNDIHIADSPFKVFIAAATGEARKLELAQFHDNIPVGKAFTFTVLTHRARGHLEGKVMTPSNITETIDIVPIEEGESYAMRFIPKEAGNYYVHVTLDGAPMRDSPFRLRVGGKELSDPTAISASGEGLRSGVTGQKTEFIISTVNAGSGTLTAQIDGPSKVTLDVYELDLGYKVRFTPLAPGDYFAAIKYNGIHIPGSPFKIPVEGKSLGGNGYNETSFVKVDALAKTSKGNVATVPEYTGDAKKVVAKGAGLNKFFPGRPSIFTIDTGLAGTNLLMVGVVTTKGPCDEVIVKHQGSGHYSVNYRIPDRVKGFIFIKYGDEEIPGSPFAIQP